MAARIAAGQTQNGRAGPFGLCVSTTGDVAPERLLVAVRAPPVITNREIRSERLLEDASTR